MKRILPALLALGLAGALTATSCGVPDAGLAVQGAVEPKVDPQTLACSFAPGASTAFVVEDTVEVAAMQTIQGRLSRYVGLQVQSTLVQPKLTTPSGDTASSATANDAVIQAADIEIDDLNGTKLASETVVVNAYVPAGSQGVAILDYLSPKPMSDLVQSRSTAFDVLLKVKLSGKTVSGSSEDTGDFTFPVHVRYDGLTTTDDGGVLALSGSTDCG